MIDAVLHDLRLDLIADKDWDLNPNGRLLVFEEPVKNAEYCIGVDVGTGKGLTNTVLHVLRKGSIYAPDTQVAELACDFLTPHEMAPVANLIGNWYWNTEYDLPALMSIECNNVGESMQYDLETHYGYTNFFIWKVYDRQGNIMSNKLGWWTTPRTRRKIVIYGEQCLRTKQWIVNSPWFIDEMADFEPARALSNTVVNDEALALARHKSGAKDDRLFAGFIANWCMNDMPEDGDPVIERQRLRDAQAAAKAQAERGEDRRDYRNTAVTYGSVWGPNAED